MKKLLVGVVLGMLLTFAASWAYVAYIEHSYKAALQKANNDPNAVKKKAPFSLESKAYLDNAPCSNIDSTKAVGTWEGERYYPDKKMTQVWRAQRRSNGTYRISFLYESDSDTETNFETGLWSLSNCLYTTIVKTVDAKPVLYQEVYRVHSLSDVEMEYTNFRTGNTFVLKKVR